MRQHVSGNLKTIREEFSRLARSDHLPVLANLFSYSHLRDYETFKVILDTNIILKDLSATIKNSPRVPGYRTHIVECIEAGYFEAYIPRQVEQEVEEKIPIKSGSLKVCQDKMFSEWRDYRRLLRKRKVSDVEISRFKKRYPALPDEDDIPIAILAKKYHAIILTENKKHLIPISSVVVANERNFACASKDYVRELSVSLFAAGSIMYVGNISVTLVFGLFKSLPRGLVLFTFLTVCVVMAFPSTRVKVIKLLESHSDELAAVKDVVIKAINLVSEIHENTSNSLPTAPKPELISKDSS